LSALGVNFGLGHGHVGQAGSSVVHLVGGVAALAGAVVLGPRLGKFARNGKPVAIPGHSMPILRSAGLASTLDRHSPEPDPRVTVIAVSTMLASAAGAFSAMLFVWLRYGKPEPSILANAGSRVSLPSLLPAPS